MSGWDVSSTPNWGPQDEPEEARDATAPVDGSRDFAAQGYRAHDPRTQPAGAQDSRTAGTGRPGHTAPAGFPQVPDDAGPAGSPASPPPEFFSDDYGQPEDHEIGPGGFPQRTPGRSLRDLPRREAPSSPAPQNTPYGQPAVYGQPDVYGQPG